MSTSTSMSSSAFYLVHVAGGGRQRQRTPIAAVADRTPGGAVVTVRQACYFGSGTSRRAVLVLESEEGGTATATLTSDRLRNIPDFLLVCGTRVYVRGVVCRLPDAPPVLELVAVSPPNLSSAPVRSFYGIVSAA